MLIESNLTNSNKSECDESILLRGTTTTAPNVLAIMVCAANIGPRSSRPNASATVRYLRRAVAIERRAEGDLTGHHFRLNGPRTVAF